MAKRLPFIGSGRNQEGGELAARKQDLLAHSQGTGFRHTADNIDMNPILPNIDGYNVQEALENLLTSITSSGSGFISIGSISGNLGSYNVGSSATPLLSDAFNAAFADSRLSNGGTILLLSGTYNLTAAEQIVVPSGITIMGELDGTTISKTGLDKSMFKILESELISIEFASGSDYFGDGSTSKVTKLFNLTLIDNFGGVTDKEPCLIVSPMIECDVRSNFECEYVKFLGRIGEGVSPAVTCKAIGYTGISNSGIGTMLSVQRCYFDGLRIGIDFIPTQHSGKDYIVVNNCKARTYGNYSNNLPELNCFVNMSNSTAVFSNNYHRGGGAPTYCFVVSGGASYDDITYSITGNSGGGYDCKNIFVVTESASFSTNTLYTVKSGNNWGPSVNNEWFITVGADGYGSSGDLIGTYAISHINLNVSGPTTCIVNPGTYNIFASNSYYNKNIKFIGNPTKEKPVFLLDMTGEPIKDVLGRETLFVGHEIKNIKFKSNTTFQSVTVTGKDYYNIDNCEFENAGLVVQENEETLPAYAINVNLKNTKFTQTGSYCNVSTILPEADNVVVENCTWTGNGYVGGVFGADSMDSYKPETKYANILFKNCVMSLYNGYISTLPPTQAQKKYFSIFTYGSAIIDSCKIICGDSYNRQDVINNSLLTSNVFDSFILFACSEGIVIKNSIINSPDQVYNTSAIPYAISGVHVNNCNHVYLQNNKFIGGKLLLDVIDEDSAKKIDIINNHFRYITYTSVDGYGSGTLININAINNDGEHGKVNFENNNVEHYIIGNEINISPLVNNSASASSQQYAVVQIFSDSCDVNVSNNYIHGTQTIFDNTPGPGYAHSNLLISNTDISSNAEMTFTNINNNKLDFDKSKYYTNTTHPTSCYDFRGLNVRSSSDARVTNNNIRIDGEIKYQSGPSNPYYTYTGIYYRAINYAGIISQNSCYSGDSIRSYSDIGRMYGVKLDTGSPKGLLINNINSVTGLDAIAIQDDSGTSWVKSGNLP